MPLPDGMLREYTMDYRTDAIPLAALFTRSSMATDFDRLIAWLLRVLARTCGEGA
jgi:hypothetical protein